MSNWTITLSLGLGGATIAFLLLLLFDWERASAWLRWIVAIYLAGPPK